MNSSESIPYLSLLRNQIDITKVPFSDRGSRLLVHQYANSYKLYIKLAERIMGLEPGLDAYLQRKPFIDNLTLIDKDGNELEFSIVTSPQALYFQTSIGEFGVVFQDLRTISIGIPVDQTAGLRFEIRPVIWYNSDFGGELKSIRNFGYNANGEIVKNQISPQNGNYQVELIVQGGLDRAITLHVNPTIDVSHETLPFSEAQDHANNRWRNWFSRLPSVDEQYRKTYAYAWWIMANNLISPLGNVVFEAMTPSKTSYIGLWLWDSALHALAYRYIDPELARNQIRAMLAYQLPDGMIPDAIHDEGVVVEIDHPFTAEVTKPPILAWAAMKLHEIAPDLDFLQEIYVPLVRWNAWWFSMNDDDVDGLAQYNHPYSSGLDDNPMWDFGMPVESPDLNTYLCVQMGSLAMIAEALGMDQEAAMWRRRAEAIVHRMIADFWDDNAGVFRTMHNDEPLPVITPFNLYPLWTGQLPDDIKRRLLDHLRNPDEFWGDFALPTVARNDPKYDPETMWRGPVWANVNYFFIEALKQIQEDDLANELREKTLRMIMNHPSIYEFYNAETGIPPTKAANIFGWTAAVFIDLVLQLASENENQKTVRESTYVRE
jgi:glycogen debranching enzyme